MDPVVIALTLGMVIVGEEAWAVKGMAAPDLMRLQQLISVSEDNGCSKLIAYAWVNLKPES